MRGRGARPNFPVARKEKGIERAESLTETQARARLETGGQKAWEKCWRKFGEK